jgi:hypothetical protein
MGDLQWGVVRSQHWLLYGSHHGWGRKWVPWWLRRLVVKSWNSISCRFMGHKDYGLGCCGMCCKSLPADMALMDALRREVWDSQWEDDDEEKRD